MNENRHYRSTLPNTDSSGRRTRREYGKKSGRQDWGYTEQYRRMMQRYPQPNKEPEN